MTTTPNHSNGQQIHTKSSQQDIGGSKRWNQSNSQSCTRPVVDPTTPHSGSCDSNAGALSTGFVGMGLFTFLPGRMMSRVLFTQTPTMGFGCAVFVFGAVYWYWRRRILRLELS
jgi:hypothetical protein